MTDSGTQPLHPALQKLWAAQRRLARLLSLLIFLPTSGAMLFALTIALGGNRLGDLLLLVLIGIVTLVIVVLLGGVLVWLQHRTEQQIAAAQNLLRNSSAIEVRLHVVAVHGANWLMTVQDQAAALAPDILNAALLQPAPGAYTALKSHHEQPLVAQAYCQDRQPGSRLVALHGDNAWLGHWVNQAQYLRTYQRRWAMLAVLLLLASLLLFFYRT